MLTGRNLQAQVGNKELKHHADGICRYDTISYHGDVCFNESKVPISHFVNLPRMSSCANKNTDTS